MKRFLAFWTMIIMAGLLAILPPAPASAQSPTCVPAVNGPVTVTFSKAGHDSMHLTPTYYNCGSKYVTFHAVTRVLSPCGDVIGAVDEWMTIAPYDSTSRLADFYLPDGCRGLYTVQTRVYTEDGVKFYEVSATVER